MQCFQPHLVLRSALNWIDSKADITDTEHSGKLDWKSVVSQENVSKNLDFLDLPLVHTQRIRTHAHVCDGDAPAHRA